MNIVSVASPQYSKADNSTINCIVTFDNGQYVIGSLKHPFMMRDGSYKMIYELRIGDSIMPFYQKDFLLLLR